MLKADFVAPDSANIEELYSSRHDELVISGPYQSGKTFPCLVKLHLLHLRHPLWTLVVRKRKTDLLRTVIPDFENKVLPYPPSHPLSFVEPYGRQSPQWYNYPNGGRMTLGGMDDPDKFLSGGYDVVYYNQCEQATLDEWEKLKTRCNGRSGRWKTKDGRVLHQLLGDCNPDSHLHWIKKREQDGKLRLVNCTHADNPLLFRDGDYTVLGRKTVADLESSLTGVRYQRGFLGQWVSAEGQVYEFDRDKHVISDLPDMRLWQKYRAIDFGLTHPFVCLWFALNPKTGTLILYREWRRTNMLVADHAKEIMKASWGERTQFTVADHDAEDNLTLTRAGIPTRLANKSVLQGIDAVKRRLKERTLLIYDKALIKADPELARQGKPLRTLDEFAGYVHKPLESHVGDASKDDLPIKRNDDGLDALRYMVMALDSPRQTFGFAGAGVKQQTRI